MTCPAELLLITTAAASIDDAAAPPSRYHTASIATGSTRSVKNGIKSVGGSAKYIIIMYILYKCLSASVAEYTKDTER